MEKEVGGMSAVAELIHTTDAKRDLENLKSLFHQETGMLHQLKQSKKEMEEQVLSLQEEKNGLELKRIILQEASQEARKQAKETLESVATNALQYIMGEHVSLVIKLSEKGNSPTASFFVRKEYGDYVVETDPAEEEGGGIADIVAFSVFIAMLQLTGGSNVASLFLDEPSKFVSAGYSDKVANFLYDVSKSINRQAFMVTHDEFIAKVGDVAYLFMMDQDGKSKATNIS